MNVKENITYNVAEEIRQMDAYGRGEFGKKTLKAERAPPIWAHFVN